MCDRLAPDPKQGSFGIAPRVTQSETSGGPGPGQYPIKSAVGDTFQFSMRGREKFGAPTGKSDDPTTGKEPGPGQYPKVFFVAALLEGRYFFCSYVLQPRLVLLDLKFCAC